MRGSRRGSEDRGGVYETISKPEFKRIPEDLEVREGNPVRFDTLVLGRPVPELFWYRNGVQVHHDDNHKVSYSVCLSKFIFNDNYHNLDGFI